MELRSSMGGAIFSYESIVNTYLIIYHVECRILYIINMWQVSKQTEYCKGTKQEEQYEHNNYLHKPNPYTKK